MKTKLEYRAVVAVDVDLETGEVESVAVRAATDDDERVDLTVSRQRPVPSVATPDPAASSLAPPRSVVIEETTAGVRSG